MMKNIMLAFVAVIGMTPLFASEDDHDHHHGPAEYTHADFQKAALKGKNRFERLNLPGSKLLNVKTWEGEEYIWVRVVYTVPSSQEKKSLILACHWHGLVLGCHKKDVAGPGEPVDDEL
jgi:hypothetical protein